MIKETRSMLWSYSVECVILIIVILILIYIGIKIIIPTQMLAMCKYCGPDYTKNFTGDMSGSCSDMKAFCIDYLNLSMVD